MLMMRGLWSCVRPELFVDYKEATGTQWSHSHQGNIVIVLTAMKFLIIGNSPPPHFTGQPHSEEFSCKQIVIFSVVLRVFPLTAFENGLTFNKKSPDGTEPGTLQLWGPIFVAGSS